MRKKKEKKTTDGFTCSDPSQTLSRALFLASRAGLRWARCRSNCPETLFLRTMHSSAEEERQQRARRRRRDGCSLPEDERRCRRRRRLGRRRRLDLLLSLAPGPAAGPLRAARRLHRRPRLLWSSSFASRSSARSSSLRDLSASQSTGRAAMTKRRRRRCFRLRPLSRCRPPPLLTAPQPSRPGPGYCSPNRL